MKVAEKRIEIEICWREEDLLSYVGTAIKQRSDNNEIPLRFAVVQSSAKHAIIEVMVLHRDEGDPCSRDCMGKIISRPFEDTSTFNAVLVVPTGIGADIGGHAGDAGPIAQLMASVCDTLVVHPNVVNASDINELPSNALYVEGSILSSLLVGTIGLVPVRNNRVLVVLGEHDDSYFTNAAINSVNAARATYGLDCVNVVRATDSPNLHARYSESGRAVGEVTSLRPLIQLLGQQRRSFDAVAISSVIKVPERYHTEYYESSGLMVNPWGGVESMLTHAISSFLDIQSAHSPMLEARHLIAEDFGIVDPRLAAEAVSMTFFQSILKGLHRSPRVIYPASLGQRGVFDVTNISCVVIPDGCIGIPVIAALHQGIRVIAVRENRSLMKNNLAVLPWKPSQLVIVDNYWEAAGVLISLKAGIAPASVRRPIKPAEQVDI